MISDKKKIRCAIYSRKSHEEGLDQDFNSLDAQRAAAEAYVQSQVHEGWKLLPARYDGGGFSGGNMDRPALNALIEDIAKEQGVDRSYVGRMLQLTSLAPDIVESILAGQAFADISLQHCRKGIPVFWEEQRRTLIAAD